MEEPRKRQEMKANSSADEYNSDDYNSGDSFINDSDESSFENEDYSGPQLDRQAKTKKKSKKKRAAVKQSKVKKMGRLKKMKELRGPRSDEEGDGFVVHGGEFEAKLGRPDESDLENGPGLGAEEYDTQRMLENIFNDKEYQDELAADQENKNTNDGDEEDEMTLNPARNISQLMNPEERQKHFLTLKDQKIKEKDIPERLQLRFENRSPPTQEDIVHESRWIADKLLRRKGLIELNKETLEIKIYAVLENLLWKNQEIMYIWTYSRQEITSNKHGDPNVDPNNELTLDDLWFIYEMDQEWQRCFDVKLAIANLRKLLGKYETLSNLAERAVGTAEDMDELNVCYQYLKFCLKNYMNEEEIETYLENKNKTQQKLAKGFKKMQRIKKKDPIREMRKLGIHNSAYSISIKPEDLAENFQNKRQVKAPSMVNQLPNSLSEKLTQKSVGFLNSPVKTLKSICKMVAAEYFHHPVVRLFLKDICRSRLYIMTEPTLKGKTTVNVYHYYFPAKRITGIKVNEIRPNLWMLILEAEQKGLVKVKFVMGHRRDPKWEELKRRLEKYVLDMREPKSREEKNFLDKWNTVRSKMCDFLVKNHARPMFEKEIRQRLTESGRKAIISEIKRSFRGIINMKPYRPAAQDQETASFRQQAEDDHSEEEENSVDHILGVTGIRVLACTMTTPMSALNRDAEAVFVSLDGKGEIDGVLRLKNCFRKGASLKNPNLQAIYERNINELKRFVTEQLPKVIVISPKSLVMQGLKIELNDLFTEIFDNMGKQGLKPFVMWGDNRVAEIASRSQAYSRFVQPKDETIKEAVSLGRYVQDPLAEALNLWSHKPSENLVLKMSLHPMQRLVPLKELHEQLETVVLEVVGHAGVNLNRCARVKHLESPLQFVSGLGPRKSQNLLEKLKKLDLGFVGTRKELGESPILPRNTYLFCIGFLKFYRDDLDLEKDIIPNKIDPLDLTRIHPFHYKMANKMAIECLEIDTSESQANSEQTWHKEVIKVMMNPDLFKELDLVDYGQHLSQRHKCNMHWKVDFIETELKRPFFDQREPFRTNPDTEELFYMLTGESKHSIQKLALTLMQVRSINSKTIRLSTSNGVQATIPLETLNEGSFRDDDITEEKIREKYPIDSHVYARIRQIDFMRQRLNVSLRKTDIENHKDFLRFSKILEKWDLSDRTFKVFRLEDYPALTVRAPPPGAARFILRKITHPMFKNLGMTRAKDFLKKRPLGDFIIRPSSQGQNFLNITWKLFPRHLCHLLIREGSKLENEVISKQLYLDKEKEAYSSLDEIIQAFINPINLMVKPIIRHAKFLPDLVTTVVLKVTESKEERPQNIPYFFHSAPKYPRCMILTYILTKLEVVHELIRLRPDGLVFHGRKFFDLPSLIQFFKQNLKTSEYKTFLRNSHPISFSDPARHGVKKESRVKMEDRRGHYSDSSSRSPRRKGRNFRPERNYNRFGDKREMKRFPHRGDRFRDDRGYNQIRSPIKQEDRGNWGSNVKTEHIGHFDKQSFNQKFGYENHPNNYPQEYKRLKMTENPTHQQMNFQTQYPPNYMNPQPGIPNPPPQNYHDMNYHPGNQNSNFGFPKPPQTDMMALAGQMNPQGQFSNYVPVIGAPAPPPIGHQGQYKQVSGAMPQGDAGTMGSDLNPVHNSGYKTENQNEYRVANQNVKEEIVKKENEAERGK